MHIHTTAATPAGDSLAGFQAAQTASALRRARELGDAAARIKARSQSGGIEEDTASFASLMAATPAAQSPSLSQGNAVASVIAREQEANDTKDAKGEFDAKTIAQDFYGLPAYSPAASSPVNPEAFSRASSAGTGVSAAYPGNSNAGNLDSSASNTNPNDWLRPVSYWA